MCGRFASTSTPDDLAAYFHAVLPTEAALEPSYNVAPTDDVAVVATDRGVRAVTVMHWGLVPYWAKDPGIGSRMINARAEGIAEKGAFKAAFRHRRCIVAADGFYEWRAVPGRKAKQPYFIHRPDGEPYAFAGLWERWRHPGADGGGELRSTTIVTTTPNEAMAAVHDRMPVILPASAWDRWLDPDVSDPDALADLLVPAPSELTVMHPVSTDVGNVRNDGPHLIEPVEPAPPAG